METENCSGPMVRANMLGSSKTTNAKAMANIIITLAVECIGVIGSLISKMVLDGSEVNLSYKSAKEFGKKENYSDGSIIPHPLTRMILLV
jgi:hypothetical protein